MARATGTFFDSDKNFLHAAAFVLAPGGVVALSCFSSGAIGRLTPAELIPLLKHWKENPPAP